MVGRLEFFVVMGESESMTLNDMCMRAWLCKT